ncbi:myotrophin-like [Amphiura filiformis]|uniref:myotrophin-like n=1 Tax=Amphiura filiformis TaxID=82378 RepID=UPI003B20D0F7
MSELRWACQNGDLAVVKQLVEAGKADVSKEIDGRTPLHFAADYGQLDVIDYLVDKKANVNATDKHGISVILAAIWEGHTECVKFLLSKGASKSGKAPDGSGYLDCAEKDDIKALLK